MKPFDWFCAFLNREPMRFLLCAAMAVMPHLALYVSIRQVDPIPHSQRTVLVVAQCGWRGLAALSFVMWMVYLAMGRPDDEAEAEDDYEETLEPGDVFMFGRPDDGNPFRSPLT